MSEFRTKLKQGFKLLKDRGYFVSDENLKGKGFWCCQSCGTAALPEGTINYAFYHEQDLDGVKEAEKQNACGYGTPTRPDIYIAWGGNGEGIRKAFLEAGLAVEWDGTDNQRILVTMPPIEPVLTDDQKYAGQMEALIGTMH